MKIVAREQRKELIKIKMRDNSERAKDRVQRRRNVSNRETIERTLNHSERYNERLQQGKDNNDKEIDSNKDLKVVTTGMM